MKSVVKGFGYICYKKIFEKRERGAYFPGENIFIEDMKIKGR